jgi:predicted nuclease of predicted toxin-antitoxin system
MRFLFDMNMSPLSVKYLRERGFDVIRISDILPANTPDPIVLEFARTHGRILVSQDLDFSKILALENQTSPSLITIRMTNCDPASIAERLIQVISAAKAKLNKLVPGCAITVDDNKIRLRSLPIKPIDERE